MKITRLLTASLFALLPATLLHAQAPTGETTFKGFCASCHMEADNDKIPSISKLQRLNANTVLRALTEGAMRIQGDTISAEQRVAVAEYLSGGKVIEQPINFTQGMCASIPALATPGKGAVWNGWGSDEKNNRYQTETGGLSVANVSKLKLKWAFGVPDVASHRAQPAIYGERLYMGSQAGVVFSLNALNGCTYWSYKAEAGIRTAMSLGEVSVQGSKRMAVFFNDLKAFAYALDAETGALLWKTKVDEHQAAMGTGAVKFHNGRLYVPTAGLSEEGIANGNASYVCCSFRGSVTALDASTGKQVWKTYTVPEPQLVRMLPDGRELRGPAGGSVWNSPTVDVKRNLLYFTTGNAYVEPPVSTTNAVMAVNLDTGQLVWVNQTLEADIWSGGCEPGLGGSKDNPGCAKPVGPDFDFSASAVLTTTKDGKDLIIATQKSGKGYAFDPADQGNLLWTYQWGQGAAAGGVYGTASDGERAFFAVADNRTNAPGGIHGVDLKTGKRLWFTPPADMLCSQGPGCSPVQAAAVTAIPGVVFSGSYDGGVRAYDSSTGKTLWTFDTNPTFDTVNGVKANGGSMDGPGPVIANGMVYVTAGNGGPFGNPGNVLLVFGTE
jgi:polyvinyl alcohol dehydrogenase (cytochrome)